MSHTPTIKEIQVFGQQIGIASFPIFDDFDCWWNVLHELGHYAVKTDSYIKLWQLHNTDRTEVPFFNWFESSYDEWTKSLKAQVPGIDDHYDMNDPVSDEQHFAKLDEWIMLFENDVPGHIDSRSEQEVEYQSTPGEWAVRQWCLDVLRCKGWIYPPACQEWQNSNFRKARNKDQWKLNPQQEQIAVKQLCQAGIDVKNKAFRPTKTPIGIAIAIALAETNAAYGRDFRVKKIPKRNYQIQLQHDFVVQQLADYVSSPQRWQRWVDSGVLALP